MSSFLLIHLGFKLPVGFLVSVIVMWSLSAVSAVFSSSGLQPLKQSDKAV